MKIITIDVKCPWCGSEPGERCTEGDMSRPGGWRYVREGYGHLERTIEVEPLIPIVEDGPASRPPPS